MTIFHFPQFEHELFCWYFKRLNAFLAQCGYCVGKWEILGIIDEDVNSETLIFLQFWVAWDLFEFEKASRFYGNSFHDPCPFYARSYYAPLWCDMCNSSTHNVSSCPYYA